MLWIPATLFKYYAYFPRQYCFALSAQFVIKRWDIFAIFLDFKTFQVPKKTVGI